MNTFNKLWGVITPEQAKKRDRKADKGIRYNRAWKSGGTGKFSLVGKDIYEKLVKGYTEKQWGRKAAELPAFIIKKASCKIYLRQ